MATRLPARLRRFGGINALEPYLLPRHFKRIGIHDPGHAAQDLHGACATAVLRRLGRARGQLPVLAHAGGLPFLMTMPCARDLAPLGTVRPAKMTAVRRPPARMSRARASGQDGREQHGQEGEESSHAGHDSSRRALCDRGR